jgi:3-oxoacyl-[acyl-carrier protein] reductase
VAAAVTHFGGLDIVVTGAGIPTARYKSREHDPRRPGADPLDAFLALEPDAWDEVIGVNLSGNFHALRAGMEQMIRQGRGGVVVTLSSIAAANPTHSGSVAYTASKFGALGLTKHLATLGAPPGSG